MYSRNGKLVDRRELLKVKLKSLAAEARIIRQMELQERSRATRIRKGWVKADGSVTPGRVPSEQMRHELWLHRIGPLRYEARLTHIAYGLIRGKTLDQIEGKKPKPFDEARVKAMLMKYGPKGAEELLERREDEIAQAA